MPHTSNANLISFGQKTVLPVHMPVVEHGTHDGDVAYKPPQHAIFAGRALVTAGLQVR
jgi:hypothetical protein